MSLSHSATVTARHQSGTTGAIRITIHRTIPRITRRVAVALIAFSLLDLVGWGITGRWMVGGPYCWFALILGVGLWLSEGHRRLGAEAERLCSELRERQAEHDLGSMIQFLLDNNDK